LTKQQQKIVQYLNQAHGSEQALTRQLQAQIAMTPKGRYRNGLETTSTRPAGTPSVSRTACANWGREATTRYRWE
jgi:hypothetical protein